MWAGPPPQPPRGPETSTGTSSGSRRKSLRAIRSRVVEPAAGAGREPMGDTSAMVRREDYTWPPSPELLAWRPDRYELSSDEDELDEFESPSCTLAFIELESTLSDVLMIRAVEHSEGGYRIVVHDEYEMPFRPPIEHATAPLTLGELLRVLDETELEGEPDEIAGVGHRFRERNAPPGVSRADLASFVTIRSDVYPQLESLDRSRGEQWAAERT